MEPSGWVGVLEPSSGLVAAATTAAVVVVVVVVGLITRSTSTGRSGQVARSRRTESRRAIDSVVGAGGRTRLDQSTPVDNWLRPLFSFLLFFFNFFFSPVFYWPLNRHQVMVLLFFLSTVSIATTTTTATTTATTISLDCSFHCGAFFMERKKNKTKGKK